MGDVRLAVVGSGDMGGAYAEAIARHTPAARLMAVCGGRRAPGIAAHYGALHVERYDDLLARPDVDGVVIAIPHSLHREAAIAAARAGKHVLIEKPMALDTAECDAMIEAARDAGVTLSVILTMRFDQHMQAAKRIIDESGIGQVRMLRLSGLTPGYDMGHKTWIGEPGEGGALLDWGSHGFDVLRWIAGADPVRLSALTARLDSTTPVADATAMVQVAYANGVMAQMWMSYELPAPGLDSPFRLWVIGERGMLEISRFGPCRLGRGTGWETVMKATMPDWSIERRHDPVRLQAIVAQVNEFADAIATGRSTAAPPEAGRWAVMQVEAARRSAVSGATVPLPLARGA
jgi:predicted dehydrogenase